MRYAAQFLLIAFFVVMSLVMLLSGTVKFQLLNFRFWQDDFTKNNVYQNIALSTKNSLESQIGKEGGSKNDAKVLTDLITPGNVKDFVDKNLQNILSFANGEKSQIIVYLPVDKFPKNLLPGNLSGIQSEMPLTDLLTKFNYQGYTSLPLASFSQAGKVASLIFFGSVILLIVFMILLILLVEAGGRFIAPGVALLLSGLLTISSAKVIESLKSLQSFTQGNSSFIYNLAGIILPPLINGLTRIWYPAGIGLVALGLILFFIRKPSYNRQK